MEKSKALDIVLGVGQWLRNALLVTEGSIPEEGLLGALEKDYENIGNFKDACDWAVDNNDNHLASVVISEKIKDNSRHLLDILKGVSHGSEGKNTLIRNVCAIMANSRLLNNMIRVGPKKTSKESENFRSLVQCEDKDKVLKRLHVLIDGKGGVKVAAVLCKALEDKIIIKFPTEREYKSEFKLIGSFDSIRKGLRSGSAELASKHIKIM